LLFLREKNRRAEVLQRLCPKCGSLLAADGSCDACGRAGV
jgi:ribosomal protein S27AE